MAMSWTHQELFSFQFPRLTQQQSQSCCLKQTQSTGVPLPRKALMHTLQVHEKSHIVYLKINHGLTLSVQHQSTAVKDLPHSVWKSLHLRILIPSSPSCCQQWTPLSSLFLHLISLFFPSCLPRNCTTLYLTLLAACEARCMRSAIWDGDVKT